MMSWIMGTASIADLGGSSHAEVRLAPRPSTSLWRISTSLMSENRSESVSIATCESEPIHLLGAIQPFGFLLAVNNEWMITCASENVQSYLGAPIDEIIGRPVASLVSDEVLHDIRGRLQVAAGPGIVERLFGRRLTSGGPFFDIAIHQSGAEFVLEFEETAGETDAVIALLRSMIVRVEQHRSQPSLFREAARQVRALTQFDRVMVYHFDDDGAGEVVAETAKSGLPSYLGLRYPASDIPAQARALYERNPIRIIVDVDAEPVPVRPVRSPEGVLLDLSMSMLRSVSPIHLEYLRNMGVRTSMSISLILGGKLWGLIACHHGAVRHIGFDVRSTAELFGQIFSYLLEAREREEESLYASRAREIHHRIVSAFAHPNSSLKGLPAFLEGVEGYIDSDGIGLYHSGEITLVGLTPTTEEFASLIKFLNGTASSKVFSSHCLSEALPAAADSVMTAAGVLSIPISRTPRDYLVFFRREITKTVTWAGEPVKAETSEAGGIRLSPRKSFEAWREVVRNQSRRWTAGELHAAEALRVTLIEVVLRLSEAAQADRAGAQQRQEILIAELNHRVRNVLALVRGLINQSATLTNDVGVLIVNLDNRIRSMARCHDILSSVNWRPASLHSLLCAEIDTYAQSEERVVLNGPDILLQPKAFTAMALVAHELVTNALKYGALSSPHGQVSIKTLADREGNVSVSWIESGGPPVTPPTRRGFGSTILEHIIPFDVNGVSSPQYLPSGFRIDMTLPARVAQCSKVDASEATSRNENSESVAGEADLAALLDECLVVEDNLFIAVDAEDMLRKLGAGEIQLARSIAEAKALMAERRFSFALLDVNLGDETSLPIARDLRTVKTPFAFGTGYGEVMDREAALANAPVVSKPYHRAEIMRALTQLIRAPSGAASGEAGSESFG